MSYLPNFLVNKEELDTVIENDENYIYNMDEKGTAEYLLSYDYDIVIIREVDFYFIDTELSYHGDNLRDYFEENEVEYYIFGG